MMNIHKRQKGFTLIELLIVVAIIGIIAAILIPNFLDALHKGRQKRTMGDMRQLGLALGTYWTDNGGGAAAGAATVNESDWTGSATVADLQTALVPDYAAAIPENDGWGHALTFHVILDNPPRSNYAMMISGGRDGGADSSWSAGAFSPTDYDQDIVWADGGFIRAPSGAQASAGGGTP